MSQSDEAVQYGISGLLIRGFFALLMACALIGSYFFAIFAEGQAVAGASVEVVLGITGCALVLSVATFVLNRKLRNPVVKSFLSLVDFGVVGMGLLLSNLVGNAHLVIPFFVVGLLNTILGMRRDCMA